MVFTTPRSSNLIKAQRIAAYAIALGFKFLRCKPDAQGDPPVRFFVLEPGDGQRSRSTTKINGSSFFDINNQ